MFSDYLVRLVTLETLGSGVPAEDVSLGIERKNGIVEHAVDKETVQVSRFKADVAMQRRVSHAVSDSYDCMKLRNSCLPGPGGNHEMLRGVGRFGESVGT